MAHVDIRVSGELKSVIEIAAKADGRSASNWCALVLQRALAESNGKVAVPAALIPRRPLPTLDAAPAYAAVDRSSKPPDPPVGLPSVAFESAPEPRDYTPTTVQERYVRPAWGKGSAGEAKKP